MPETSSSPQFSPRESPRPAPRGAERPDLLALSTDDLAGEEALSGESPYRAAQIFRWLHKAGARGFAEMTNLPGALRARLEERFRIPSLEVEREAASADGSRKTVFRLADGAVVESVLMREGGARTLCISTQVGCAVGCVFCATGAIGLARNLTPGEILGQVYVSATRLERDEPGERITHVVYMGMGEPLHNVEATLVSLRRLVAPDGLGLSIRRITLSTSGYPERIDRLAREGPRVRLAISLTAPTDALRTSLIPLNKKYPIASLVEAGRAYERATGSRVTFEYVLLEGVNDSVGDARALARLLRGGRVNLIPLNPHPFSPMAPPTDEVVDRFHRTLKASGVTSTVRRSKGREIQAACGQLAARA